MSPTARAVLGASISALLTLCVHPASRPFMTGVVSRAPTSRLANCIDSNSPNLAPPTTLSEASLWMEAAAHRIVHRGTLTEKEQSTLVGIADAAAAKDKVNPYWLEMKTVFLANGGDLDKATDAWIEASARPLWNDYQSPRWMQARSSLSALTNVKESWQLAYLYYSRSDDIYFSIRGAAEQILSRADYQTEHGLNVRYATLLNADVLRLKSHSTKSCIAALDIIDLTTYPSNSVLVLYRFAPKKVWTGEMTVLSNLTKVLHQPEKKETASKIYGQAEGWRALTIHDSNDETAEILAFSSVLCSSIAGAFLIVSATGGLIWILGLVVAWRLSGEKKIGPVFAAAVAIFLGGLVAALTNYLPAAIATALCAAFLTVAPERSRHSKPSDLGPLFGFMAIVLGLICSGMFATYLVASTAAANAVLPFLEVPSDFMDKPLLAGLAAVAFGLVMLVAPIWAVVHRLGTPHVLSLALKRFGSFVCAMGLLLSIVLGPLAVYTDRQLESTFNALVNHETLHYELINGPPYPRTDSGPRRAAPGTPPGPGSKTSGR